MKLIDILVERLPDLGGWPIDSDDERTLISSLPGVSWGLNGGGYYAFRGPNDSITYQQYEAALSANKPEWDGEGLPPVGCEFEFRANVNSSWKRGVMCVVDYTNPFNVVVDDQCGIYRVHELEFRPIRSEADKKRDEAIKKICEVLSVGKNTEDDAKNIYEYIKSGKIVID